MSSPTNNRSLPNLRPRSILLAAAILDLVDSMRRREPALESADVLDALTLTRDEVVETLEERDWN